MDTFSKENFDRVKKPIIFVSTAPRQGSLYFPYILTTIEKRLRLSARHEALGRNLNKNIIFRWASVDKDPELINRADELWRLDCNRELREFAINREFRYMNSDSKFIIMTYYFVHKYISQEDIRVIEVSRPPWRTVLSNVVRGLYTKAPKHRGPFLNRDTPPYPFGTSNVTVPMRSLEESTPIELCAWMVFEIIERQKIYRKLFPNVKIFKWDLVRDSPSVDRWMELFEFMELDTSKVTDGFKSSVERNPRPHLSYGLYKKHIHRYSDDEAKQAVNNHKVIYNTRIRPQGIL